MFATSAQVAASPPRGALTRPHVPPHRGRKAPVGGSPLRRPPCQPRGGTLVGRGKHFEDSWQAPPPEEELPLGVQIENALMSAFPPKAVDRVVESLRFTLADGMHEELHEGKGLQQSSSYIKGLTPVPYWDVHGGQFPWMEELEKHYETIRDELVEGLNNPNLERQGNSVWVAAVRDDAEGYGPDWRTLVLQDRCEWEPTNVSLFPKTAAAVKAACTPSVEVFFAKQAPKTGIKPHTDFTNFIMTAHLGLDCPPPPESWMKVGVETRYWENGKGMVADTSFIHSTSNESETQDRFVLIVRFWHPELTLDERNGVQFLFDAFEDPTPAGLAGAVNKAKARATLYATAAGAKKMGPAAPGLAPSAGEVEASTPEGGKGKGSGSRRKRNKRKNRVAGEGLGLLAKGMK